MTHRIGYERRGSWLLFAAPLLAILLCGCGGGSQAPQPNTQEPPGGGFKLITLDDSNIGTAGVSSIDCHQEGAETVVEVKVDSTAGLKAYYFELEYDPARYAPLSAQATDLLAGDMSKAGSDRSALLEVADLVAPGLAAHGQVLINWDRYAGFTGEGVVATVRFGPGPFVAAHAASAPPDSDQDRPVLKIDETASRLSWDYACTGDYDQNGLVTVSDLTPLGRHFDAHGPFAHSAIEAVVDGNGDGLINVSDITPLGQNYNKGINAYQVFFTTEAASRPEAGPASDSLEPLLVIERTAALGEPGQERLSFDCHQPLAAPNGWIWICAVHDGIAGPASASIQVGAGDNPGNVEPAAQLTADPLNGVSPQTVAFDASASTDTDGAIVKYEWDWNSADDVWDWQDGGTEPTVEYIYHTPGTYTATVRVTDNLGALAYAQVELEIARGPNQDPVAVISADLSESHTSHEVIFDATQSYDWDGEVVEYAWDFHGDGVFYGPYSSGYYRTSFSTPGTYQVMIQVTDDEGATGEASIEITITQNQPPSAVVNASPLSGSAPLNVTFDPTGTYDPEGELDEVYWDLAGNKTWRFIYEDIYTEEYLLEPLEQTFYLSGEWECSFYANDEHGARSEVKALTVTVDGWETERWNLPLTPGGGECLDMMVIDGRLAIAMNGRSDDEHHLYFCMAANSSGQEWLDPVIVDEDLGIWPPYCDLGLINGLPAISYHHHYDDRIYYVTARDLEGREWNEPVTVDSEIGDAGGCTTLASIAGNPAVAWGKGSSARYRRAQDVDGASWYDTVILESGRFIGSPIDMVEIAGRAGIGFAEGFCMLHYVYLSDENGTTPFEVHVVPGEGDGSAMFVDLLNINGLPAYAFAGLFSRAHDVTGSSWDDASTISVRNLWNDNGQHEIVQFRDRLVCLTNESDLYLCASKDLNGFEWFSPQKIDEDVNVYGLALGAAVIDNRLFVVYYPYDKYSWDDPDPLVCRVIY